MSEPMPSRLGTNGAISGARRAAGGRVSPGLTSTTAAMRPSRSGSAASVRVSAPPIDSPPTAIGPCPRERSRAASCTRPYQSCHVVRAICCQVLPCPGSSGRSTSQPRSAWSCAHGRRDCGEPVNPWHRSRPPRGLEFPRARQERESSLKAMGPSSHPRPLGSSPAPLTRPYDPSRPRPAAPPPAAPDVLYEIATPPVRAVMSAVWNPSISAAEHIRDQGPVILASNHLAYSDTVILPASLRRTVHFLGKSDLFAGGSPLNAVFAAIMRGLHGRDLRHLQPRWGDP